MSFFRDFFYCYRFSYFLDFVRELGIIFTLLFYFLVSLLFILISPFLILVFPFVYLNERSKSWFSDSSNGDENVVSK